MSPISNMNGQSMKETSRRLLPALLVCGVLAFAISGCGERPKVLPQGTAEQQADDVLTVMHQVIQGLADGQAHELIVQKVIFLPSRWRRQQKEFQELDALGESLKGRETIVLGNVSVAGRWALIDGVMVGGKHLGSTDVPWFMFYYGGQWRWMPSSIMKDPAVEGMMDSNFDRLYAGWKAKQVKPAPAQ